MAAGKRVPLDQGLVARFESECGVQGSLRWIKVLVSKERIEEDATGKMSDDAEKDVVALAATISNEKEPFFALVRADGAGRWVQLAYVPDDSADQVRMLYSDNVQHVKETLGSAVVASVQLTSKGQVCWKEVTNAAGKVRSEARDAARQALHADAKERLDAFAKGAFSAVAFKIGEETPEEICACDATKVEEAGVPAEAVAKTVNHKDESRYILHRFSQEEKGAKKDRVRFVYYISSSTSAPRRKLYDAGEAAFVHYATEAGVAPEGTPLRINDISLFTDEVLSALTSSGDVRPEVKLPGRSDGESNSDDQTDASELSFSDFTCQESGSYYPVSCGPSGLLGDSAIADEVFLEAVAISSAGRRPKCLPIRGMVVTTALVAKYISTISVYCRNDVIKDSDYCYKAASFYGRLRPGARELAGTDWGQYEDAFNLFAEVVNDAIRSPSTHVFFICRPDSPDDCAFITVAFLKWFRTYAPTALWFEIQKFLQKVLAPCYSCPMSFLDYMGLEKPPKPQTPAELLVSDITRCCREELKTDERLQHLLALARRSPSPAPAPLSPIAYSVENVQML